MSNETVVQNFNRVKDRLVLKLPQWRPTFELLADADAFAWSHFRDVVINAQLFDTSNSNNPKFFSRESHASAQGYDPIFGVNDAFDAIFAGQLTTDQFAEAFLILLN